MHAKVAMCNRPSVLVRIQAWQPDLSTALQSEIHTKAVHEL